MGATLRVPFGMRDGTLYEPLQVPNGKACGCVCSACQRPLIAYQNHSTPHFAHAPGADCATALETAVHLAAKQVIAARRELRLPMLPYTNPAARPQVQQPLLPEQTVAVDTVRLEQWWDDMRPDIVVHHQGQNYLVEIAVTNFVDAAKRAKIVAKGFPAIEIDVRRLRDQPTFAALEKLLYTTKRYPAEWLHHPDEEQLRLAAAREAEAALAAEAQRQAAAAHERAAKFQQYRTLPAHEKLRRNLKKIRLSEEQMQFLTAVVTSKDAFGVDRLVWQSAALVYIDHVEKEQGWGDYLPCQISVPACLSWLRAIFEVKLPVEDGDSIALWRYFKHLETLGMLRYLAHKEFDLLLRRFQWDWLAAQIRNKALSAKK